MAVKELTQPLKWHGGKGDLAGWIISLMPPRCKKPNNPDPSDPGWLHYVEPYFGGGAVLLAMDPEGISEVANDINRQLANFWQTIQHQHTFADFIRVVEAQPFCEEDWQTSNRLRDAMGWHGVNLAEGTTNACTARAAWFFVAVRQSLAGRMKGFASITRKRTRRGMNEQVSAWLNCIEGLPAVHERLKRVLIRNQPAIEVIRKEDGPRTLFYLDPPYLHETRATTGEYAHEMSAVEHLELLECLGRIKGRFLLSGYDSDLYASRQIGFGWKRHEKKINNHAAGGKKKRMMTECVWCNF